MTVNESKKLILNVSNLDIKQIFLTCQPYGTSE